MQLEQKDYLRLKEYMKKNFGVNLEGKPSLIEGRLGNIIARKGFSSFSEYLDYALSDTTGDEVTLLTSRLTTNYTYFMREKQHYEFLKNTILPPLTQKLTDHDLRIWSAGCSSGEEAYTTAIVLAEYFGMARDNWDATILATDISNNVLGIAKKGLYTEDKLKDFTPKIISTYFKKIGHDEYQVSDYLRSQVVFRNFNLMEPVFPFKKKFHVIFCRNVMIYFDNKTREILARKYYNALAPGGYLIIGLSETMANIQTAFEYVMPSIYRKGSA